MNSLPLVGLSTLILIAACGSAGGASRQTLPAGTWGGDHVSLSITSEGATIEFDCAHGTLQAIQVNADGRFETAGTYVQEHAGPVREEDEAAAGNPARYKGRVEKGKMTLTVAFPEGGREPLGPFELAQGKTARLTKCL
jgi:hypothetical protein